MYRCAICGKTDTALLEARHKTMGNIMVCPSCWSKLYELNELISSGGGGGGSGCGCR